MSGFFYFRINGILTLNITFASMSTCNVNGTDGAVKERFPFL
jgi:hypothetical protein